MTASVAQPPSLQQEASTSTSSTTVASVFSPPPLVPSATHLDDTLPAGLSKSASTPGTTATTITSSSSPTKTVASSNTKSPASGSNGVHSAGSLRLHGRKRHSTSSCETGTSGHDTPRVVFGPGTISKLPSELGKLGLSSPLIVSSPSRIALARQIQKLIPNLESRILDSAVVNVPTRVVDDAVARITGHDVVISIGAGSAIGLAKAISIRKAIPHICIPTSYSGSEMSPLMAADGRKMGHRGSKVMPTVVIYDEELTGQSNNVKRFSAPSAPIVPADTTESEKRRSTGDDASWSYIHLPGV